MPSKAASHRRHYYRKATIKSFKCQLDNKIFPPTTSSRVTDELVLINVFYKLDCPLNKRSMPQNIFYILDNSEKYTWYKIYVPNFTSGQIYNPQIVHELRDFRLRRNVEKICALLGYYAT